MALVKHLNWALGEAGGAPDEHVGARLPLNPHTDSWLEALPDGLPLSKFVMHVDPEALDARALNIPKDGAPLSDKDALQNHTLCSNAATGIGCGITNLQPQQLHKAADNEQVPAGLPSRACLTSPRVSRPRRTPHTPRFSHSPSSPARHRQQVVLQLMWNLTRNELLTPLTPKQHPEFFRLLLPGEEMGAMAKMLPEQIMLRWANHHIRQYLNDNPDQKGVPKDFKISNLDSDLADGKAYSIILHQVAPFDTPCDLSALKMNPERAAQKVIDDAKRIGVDKFEVQPSDITEGRPRMNLAFLAAIINSHPALEPVQGFDLSDIMAGEAGDGREERAFRMWLQSLGLNFTINNLYDDCRSGLVILRTEDHLEPGCVDWSKVNMNPKSIYERVENCNYACDVAKKLKMKVVGIGGKDIAEGSIKLTLAVVWQLMRADVMKFLAELDMDEKDIRRWANKKVAEGGFPHLQIGSFRDPQLRNGVFILQLLRAVAPECVQADEILPGKNASECKLNAKYAISCAHKMGCRVFLTWEDIVEARPKMIICLFAAAMAEDMRRQGLKKEELLEQVELMEELEELKMEVAPVQPHTTSHSTPDNPCLTPNILMFRSLRSSRRRSGARPCRWF